MAEWLGCSSCNPGVKPSTPLLTGLVLGCSKLNSLAILWTKPIGLPPTSWGSENNMFITMFIS